eukprot:3781696-Amphidinium_carterae.1
MLWRHLAWVCPVLLPVNVGGQRWPGPEGAVTCWVPPSAEKGSEDIDVIKTTMTTHAHTRTHASTHARTRTF